MGIDEMIAFCRGYLPECDTKKNVIQILNQKMAEKPVQTILNEVVDDNATKITISEMTCPSCGHRLEKYKQYEWGNIGNRFCGGCGQAIDWSEDRGSSLKDEFKKWRQNDR